MRLTCECLDDSGTSVNASDQDPGFAYVERGQLATGHGVGGNIRQYLSEPVVAGGTTDLDQHDEPVLSAARPTTSFVGEAFETTYRHDGLQPFSWLYELGTTREQFVESGIPDVARGFPESLATTFVSRLYQ